MTWGSLAARILSVTVVLPIILTRFSVEEVALWYLFSSVIILLQLVDMGFTPTTARLIGFAMGGAPVSALRDMRNTAVRHGNGVVNETTLVAVMSTMRPVYLRLASAAFVLIVTGGTAVVWRSIGTIDQASSGWMAWAIIATSSPFFVWNGAYSSYLQGTNHIALLRRWEMWTSLASVFTSVAVLVAGGGILALVAVNQAWSLVGVVRNRWLCSAVLDGAYRRLVRGSHEGAVMAAIWPSAWRSGLGILMSAGIPQGTGVLYAQIADPASVASYLLALRLVTVSSQFSQAPFYSKLPTLARLRAEGRIDAMIVLAQRGMILSYWTYLAIFGLVGLSAEFLLHLIGAEVRSVAPHVWVLLGVAVFVERYGAMHIQLYSSTNHIIWHIANGVAGVITICFIAVLIGRLGMVAFPVAMLVGNVAFYAWYAARHSYTSLNTSFRRFESKVVVPACGALLIVCGAVMLIPAWLGR